MPIRLDYLGSASIEPPVAELPLYASQVAAGFPSPADDYVEKMLDLNEYCVRNPPATFYVRVGPDGDSMIDAGIYPSDVLCVDRSVRAVSGDMVVAALDGEFAVKELQIQDGLPMLVSHNPHYAPIRLRGEHDLMVVGVVVAVIRKLKRDGRDVRAD